MPLQETLPLAPQHRQWPVWGTVARIAVTHPALADAAQELVSGYLDQVGQACSRFRDDSELAQVQAGGAQAPISHLLAELIGAALEAARRTDGDVDPTLADDLAALGYDQDFGQVNLRVGGRGDTIPVRLTRRRRPSWRSIELTDPDGQPRVLIPAGVHLDLGASAKAHAADRAAARVASTLGCGALVALGGDIAVAGPAPSDGWQIRVQDGANEPVSVISLFRGGIATSSTRSRAWRNGTRRVHHILDPRTGDPAEPVWRTVSVVAGSCADANMLSTASIVRGWGACDLLLDAGLPARLITRSGEPVRLNDWPADERAAA